MDSENTAFCKNCLIFRKISSAIGNKNETFYEQNELLTVQNNGLKSFKVTEKLFILFSKTGFGFCFLTQAFKHSVLHPVHGDPMNNSV